MNPEFVATPVAAGESSGTDAGEGEGEGTVSYLVQPNAGTPVRATNITHADKM